MLFKICVILLLFGINFTNAGDLDNEENTQEMINFICPKSNDLFKNPDDCSTFIQSIRLRSSNLTTPHFDKEAEKSFLLETVRIGVIDVYKQCYNYNDDNFYQWAFVEIDTESYYCWRNCMANINKCSQEPADRFMKGTMSQDGTCIFWNINYYFHDQAVYYAQSTASINDWASNTGITSTQNPLTHWTYQSTPSLFWLPLTSGQRSFYIGLGRGIKRISIPHVHFQKDSNDWGKMLNIRFDQSIHEMIMANSYHSNITGFDGYPDVVFDKQYGIIGKNAILHIDYKFLAAGITLNDDLSTIINMSMRYHPGKYEGYSHPYNNRFVDNSYRRENEIINCEQGKSFQNPVTEDTILQSIITGAIKIGLSFIPGFGPILSTGFQITADYFNNPSKFENAWHSKAGDGGKAIWETIKIILEEYKNTKTLSSSSYSYYKECPHDHLKKN